MAENEEELKSLSVSVKEESEKIGLKLNAAQMKLLEDIYVSRVTIYSLDVLLLLFGTSLLFHVQF